MRVPVTVQIHELFAVFSRVTGILCHCIMKMCVRLSSLSKKTPSSKVGDELRTNLLNVHMTIT